MPNFFNKYPYTDFHELNLDWILETVKNVVAEWAATLTAWSDEQEAFQDLHDYVMNYFDNLDVQEEVNNKLDEMAADGTLDALLRPYFNDYASDLQTLTQRVDNLAHLTEGSTTGDAELIDGRAPYAGLTNNTYTSIGNAVRGQVELLTEDVLYNTAVCNNGVLNYTSFEQGSYSGTKKEDNSTRIRSVGQFPVVPGMSFYVSSPTNVTYAFFADHINGTVTYDTISAGQTLNKHILSKGFLYFTCKKPDDSAIIPSDFDSVINIYAASANNITFTGDDIMDGKGWANNGGYLVLENVSTKCAFPEVKLEGLTRIRIQQTLTNTFRLIMFFSDSDHAYLSAYTKIVKGESIIIDIADYPSAAYMGISIDNSGSSLSSADRANIHTHSLITTESVYSQPGKHIQVYEYGDDGNDWCFVRTPSDYDPTRQKPYPFVICNHGNGWIMNGNVDKANWTKKTMYVPLTDPDYIAEPTQYNGTADNYLWYSNPTIEALLTAGYIVCGCENYGDSLYGNTACRNACVKFFYHMVNNYNVEDRCYMIGASNGAMTALNAAYILQGRVKAIISQYGLTCLVSQYEHNASHQADIRTAYGITDPSISLDDLAVAVATHDPLTTDVVEGIKVGCIPPICFYYSNGDTTTQAIYNSLLLASLLDDSNKVYDTVECTGQHGDASHFDPSGYVDWFDNN